MMNFNNWTFANPEYFYLLLIIPILWIWYFLYSKKRLSTLNISTTQNFKLYSWKSYNKTILFFLRTFAIAFIIIAIARPQSTSSWQNSTTRIRWTDLLPGTRGWRLRFTLTTCRWLLLVRGGWLRRLLSGRRKT